MSEEIVNEEFAPVEEKLEAEHQQAVSELRSKVQKAKADALKKISG